MFPECLLKCHSLLHSNNRMPMAVLAASVVIPTWAQNPTPIANATALNTIVRNDLNGDYQLTNSINLSAFSPWTPIGNRTHPFTGTFDGDFHVISSLNATTQANNSAAGLFGYLFNSRVYNLTLDQPFISSAGIDSPAGAIAGYSNRSNITNVSVINGGLVRTTTIAGTSNYMDPTILNSPAGGGVGRMDRSRIKNTLATGAVSTNGFVAYAGGLVGLAYDDSDIRESLATGSVSTNEQSAYAGGLVGYTSTYSCISQSQATGAVSTNGFGAHAGGLVGYARNNSDISQSQATGAVITNGFGAYAGGLVAYTSRNSDIRQSLAIGDVSTNGESAYAGGLVGYTFGDSYVSNSLSSGKLTQAEDQVHNPIGSTRVNETQLINVLNGLSSTFWNTRDNDQFPMIRVIPPPGWDLKPINGSQNGSNTFPDSLKRYAEPDRPSNASMFSRTVSNVPDGALPSLKEAFTTPVSSIDPMTTTVTSTTAAITTPSPTTEPPTGNCPAPVGVPVFQAYDNENGWLYVVARETNTARNLMLIRYRGQVLDEHFGDCGKVMYQAPDFQTYSFYRITAGLFQKTPDSASIYLMASGGRSDGFVHLLDLVISDTNSTYTEHTVIYRGMAGFKPRVNAMVAQGKRLYLAGRANSNVMVGWFQKLGAIHFRYEDTSLTESGQALALSPDASHAYVTGLKGGEVFLRKYDVQTLTQDTAFNNQAEQVLALDNLGDSRQAIVFFKDRVYVASSVDSGEGLIVRRYHPDGMVDESFRVDQSTPSCDSNAQVALFTSDDFLHVLKYDRHGHIFAASYDTRGQGEEPVSGATMIDSPHFANIAPHGIAITDGKVYLAFRLQNNVTGELSIIEVDMPHLTVESARSPDSSSDERPGVGG